jgi:hypothetical protein
MDIGDRRYNALADHATRLPPLSPIPYLFYKADLLEECTSMKLSTLGYIDDVSLLATGTTVQHNTQALK